MDLKTLMPFGRRDVATAEDAFTSLRREMDRLLDETSRSFGVPRFWGGEAAAAGMKVDMKETEATVELDAELPGVEEKDIELLLDDGMLTIRGEKRQERQEQDKGYHLVERSYGSFMRRIAMPVPVDEAKVTARFQKGVLHVTLPKSPAAEAKARKIAITPAA